jgi:hypothetical protein
MILKIRKKAILMLKKYGCHSINNRHVQEAFNAIYVQVRGSLMRMENQIIYIIDAIKHWLKYHLRAYVLRTLNPSDKDYKSIRKMPIAEEAVEKLLGKDLITKSNHYILII